MTCTCGHGFDIDPWDYYYPEVKLTCPVCHNGWCVNGDENDDGSMEFWLEPWAEMIKSKEDALEFLRKQPQTSDWVVAMIRLIRGR